MGGDSSFMAMLRIAAFLGAIWTATKVSQNLKVSSIVLEICTGVVLGPDIVALLSPEYSQCEHSKYVECGDATDEAYIEGLATKTAHMTEAAKDEWLTLYTPSLMKDNVLQYCHREDYHHGEQGGHGDDHGSSHGSSHEEGGSGMHADDGTAHSEPSDHSANHDFLSSEDHAGSAHGEDHASDHSSDHSAGSAHGDDHSSDHSGDHSTEDAHGSGHGRRLSGGGNYHSFEECIVKTCASELAGQCQRTPDVFTLIGHTGVALMIFESGMHFDFDKAKIVGPWACVVAVLGTILPLIFGTVLAFAYGNPIMPDGLTAGTALAPTSVGISLKLLTEQKVLDKDFGQSIMTAAFVDDILSLILFNVIFSMGSGSMDFMHTFFPALMGILFMLVAVVLAVILWPRLLKNYMAPFAKWFAKKDNPKTKIEDEACLVVMLLVLVSYALITFLCGTHLWGCFIAGMSFACLGHDVFDAHHIWSRQTKRITKWMLRIFFSCTVAFSIPVGELISIDAFWKGSIMGIGPCIATKVFCAFFMGKDRWVIGWAMVGRAEFAYLIAQMGLAGGMMDQKLFSIIIWALLWATIFAPLIFTKVLRRYIAKYMPDELGAAEDGHGGHGGHGEVKPEEVHLEFPSAAGGHGHESTPATGKAFASALPGDNEPLALVPKGSELEDGDPQTVLPLEKGGDVEKPSRRQRAGAMEPAGNGAGFLCCLFFRKVVAQ